MFKLLNLSPIPSFSMAEDRQEVWGLQLPGGNGGPVFNSLLSLRGLRCPALWIRKRSGRGLLSTTSAGANGNTRVMRTAGEEAILQEPRSAIQSVCTCVGNSRWGISSYSLGSPRFAWGAAETPSARADEITLIPTQRNMTGINHYIPVTCFLLVSPCLMISSRESEREKKWTKDFKNLLLGNTLACMHRWRSLGTAQGYMCSVSGSLCVSGSRWMCISYKLQFTCISTCRTASSCELGRKDHFPFPQLETWYLAVNPAVNPLYDVQNEDADSICTYLARGKDRYTPDPKASVKKICPFN